MNTGSVRTYDVHRFRGPDHGGHQALDVRRLEVFQILGAVREVSEPVWAMIEVILYQEAYLHFQAGDVDGF
jgi:hypothetical protein